MAAASVTQAGSYTYLCTEPGVIGELSYLGNSRQHENALQLICLNSPEHVRC